MPYLFSKIFNVAAVGRKRGRQNLLSERNAPFRLLTSAAASSLLDTGISIVIMDAFVVFSFHLIPCNIGMLI